MHKQIWKLQIELLDYWHIGSGRGRGTHLDAVVDRDSHSLPYVPGKMLKGLLRNAAHCLVQWKHFDQDTLTKIFGSETNIGVIAVSDARLQDEVAAYLSGAGQAHLREQLFTEHFSTAIDVDSGNAKDKSLRGIELVIPCKLIAELEIPKDSPQEFIELLQQTVPLVRSLGAHRSRGLGRCVLSLVKG